MKLILLNHSKLIQKLIWKCHWKKILLQSSCLFVLAVTGQFFIALPLIGTKSLYEYYFSVVVTYCRHCHMYLFTKKSIKNKY